MGYLSDWQVGSWSLEKKKKKTNSWVEVVTCNWIFSHVSMEVGKAHCAQIPGHPWPYKHLEPLWHLMWFIFASLWCSLCCWKAEVDIPALSVESLLHLDLGSQGCPGPARYHLNHTLISLPCTLCCGVDNVISVKQLLPPPAASPLTLCLSLPLPLSYLCVRYNHLLSLLGQHFDSHSLPWDVL